MRPAPPADTRPPPPATHLCPASVQGLCLSKNSSARKSSGPATAGLARTASSYDGAHTNNPLRVPESDSRPKPDPKSASELYKSETMHQRIKAAENAQRPA